MTTETLFNDKLISKTDLSGNITYANDAFVKVSGYSLNELLGKPHSIVRHSDMPKAAFEQLWANVKAGRPWRGLVKNRTKQGGYYWVDAFVVPLKANGVPAGFMSVRSVPSREAVAKAEALYAEIRAGRARMPRRKLVLSIRTKLILLATAGFLGSGLFAGLGIYCGERFAAKVEDTYLSGVVTLNYARDIQQLLGAQESQAFKAMQHNPSFSLNSLHTHELRAHTDVIVDNHQKMQTLWANIERMPLTASEQALAKTMWRSAGHASGLATEVARLLNVSDWHNAGVMLITQVVPAFKQSTRDAEAFTTAVLSHAKANHEAAEAEHSANSQMIGIIFGGLSLLMAALTLAILRSMQNRLAAAERELEKMAAGDISSRPEIGIDDEIGRMLESIATTTVSLNVLVEEVRNQARQIFGSGQALTVNMTQIAAASQNQLDQVMQVSAAVEEVSHSVQGVAENSDVAAHSTQETHAAVTDSIDRLARSIAASERAIESVKGAEQTIGDLTDSIHAISAASRSIREIADQTNLLALNAAIEAARAGEQGRGFAVVADEVRKLAEKTATATSDIEDIVMRIRKNAEEASEVMNKAVSDVDIGIGGMRESGTAIQEITTLTERVSDMTHGIATAAGEQSVASDQVAGATAKITTLIEETNAAVSNANQASSQLAQMAQKLSEAVERFKT